MNIIRAPRPTTKTMSTAHDLGKGRARESGGISPNTVDDAAATPRNNNNKKKSNYGPDKDSELAPLSLYCGNLRVDQKTTATIW